MKNVLIMMTMLLLTATIAFSQEPVDDMPQPPRGKIAEKIEAQKIAFFTRILDLTPEEAQKFWPLYNEYSAKERELRPDFKARPNDLSEGEANEMINSFFETEQKRLNLTKNYYEKFKMILPAKKLVKLHFAERRFKEELLKRIKKMRDKRKRR